MDKASGMKVFALSFFVGVLCLFYFGFGKMCGIWYEPGVVITPDDIETDDSLPAQSMEPEEGENTCGATKSQCPSDMVLIEHDYCPNLVQNCKKWLDKESCGMWGKDKQGKKYCKSMMPPMRCAEFESPSICKSKPSEIVHVKVCVNKFEGNNNPSEKPEAYVSFTQAQNRCAADGKRLCTDKEWVSACEGDDNNPYSTGYVRPTNLQCNIDSDKAWVDPAKHTREQLATNFEENNKRPQCKTPTGIVNLTGNYDEWVESTNPNTPYKSVLYSGHLYRVRNRCRKSTTSHNGVDVGKDGSGFRYYDISYRCCKDAS